MPITIPTTRCSGQMPLHNGVTELPSYYELGPAAILCLHPCAGWASVHFGPYHGYHTTCSIIVRCYLRGDFEEASGSACFLNFRSKWVSAHPQLYPKNALTPENSRNTRSRVLVSNLRNSTKRWKCSTISVRAGVRWPVVYWDDMLICEHLL